MMTFSFLRSAATWLPRLCRMVWFGTLCAMLAVCLRMAEEAAMCGEVCGSDVVAAAAATCSQAACTVQQGLRNAPSAASPSNGVIA